MKEYKVEWYCVNLPSKTHVIEAATEGDAFSKAVEKYKYHEHPSLYIYIGWRRLLPSKYKNPHYVDPQREISGKVKESHSQQPAGSDGDVEWRESLGAAAKNIRNQVSAPHCSG